MTPLKDRPTADLIVIFLSAVVGFVIAGGLVGMIILAAFSPGTDIDALAGRIAALTSSLIAAIVGYLAGRSVKNGNGGQ